VLLLRGKADVSILVISYLFDLDHWHIKQPPENLASIDPAGAYIAQQAAAILQEEDEKGAAADAEGREVSMFSSFFTGMCISVAQQERC
jgi:hypothetical protein